MFISGETSLFGLVVLKKVGLTLKYGNSPESALAFIGYAMLLSGFGDTKGAFEFGRLGIRINDKFNDLQWKGAAYV
jgi:predicted ATPase